MWANARRDGRPAKYRCQVVPPKTPSVQRRKVSLTPSTRVPSSNAAKTRNPLKFAGVPQTPEPISAVSGPTFAILWNMWRTYCCLTSLFPIVDMCLSCGDTARQSCAMVPTWRLFCVLYSSGQHVSDLYPKFALRPHHVWKYGRHPSI